MQTLESCSDVQERKNGASCDETVPRTLRDTTRYLFLEVANGVLISVSEEVEDFMLYVIFLQVVH